VHVADDPVGVMRQGVDALDRQQRSLEGGHAVEGDRRHEELQHRVGAQLVPGAAQGQQAVEHATPARRPEHDAEDHAEGLRPVRQRGVEQVVRSGPDVDEDQRPEVHHRQAVAVDRSLGRLGQEVVHDAQDRRGQEEGDRVVPVPPLHERVLDPGPDRVAVRQRGRQLQAVDDVQDRDGHDRRDVEPERHVEVGLVAAGDGPEEVHREGHPDDRNRDVDRPDQLGVFLALRESQRQGDRRRDDDRLPAPEIEPAQPVAGHARLQQALRGVVDAREHHVADEGEDGRVGVQGPQPPVAEPVGGEVDLPERELGGDHHPQEDRDQPPDDRGQGEGPADRVVVDHLDQVGLRGASVRHR